MVLICRLSCVLGVILLNESNTFGFVNDISNCQESNKINATQLTFGLCDGCDSIR